MESLYRERFACITRCKCCSKIIFPSSSHDAEVRLIELWRMKEYLKRNQYACFAFVPIEGTKIADRGFLLMLKNRIWFLLEAEFVCVR